MQKLFSVAHRRLLNKFKLTEVTPENAREAVSGFGILASNESLLYRLPRQELRNILKFPCPVNSLEDTRTAKIIEVSKNLRANLKIDEANTCHKCLFKDSCPFFKKAANLDYSNIASDLLIYSQALNDCHQTDKINHRHWSSGYKLIDSIAISFDLLAQGGQEIEEYNQIRLDLLKKSIDSFEQQLPDNQAVHAKKASDPAKKQKSKVKAKSIKIKQVTTNTEEIGSEAEEQIDQKQETDEFLKKVEQSKSIPPEKREKASSKKIKKYEKAIEGEQSESNLRGQDPMTASKAKDFSKKQQLDEDTLQQFDEGNDENDHPTKSKMADIKFQKKEEKFERTKIERNPARINKDKFQNNFEHQSSKGGNQNQTFKKDYPPRSDNRDKYPQQSNYPKTDRYNKTNFNDRDTNYSTKPHYSQERSGSQDNYQKRFQRNDNRYEKKDYQKGYQKDFQKGYQKDYQKGFQKDYQKDYQRENQKEYQADIKKDYKQDFRKDYKSDYKNDSKSDNRFDRGFDKNAFSEKYYPSEQNEQARNVRSIRSRQQVGKPSPFVNKWKGATNREQERESAYSNKSRDDIQKPKFSRQRDNKRENYDQPPRMIKLEQANEPFHSSTPSGEVKKGGRNIKRRSSKSVGEDEE